MYFPNSSSQEAPGLTENVGELRHTDLRYIRGLESRGVRGEVTANVLVFEVVFEPRVKRSGRGRHVPQRWAAYEKREKRRKRAPSIQWPQSAETAMTPESGTYGDTGDGCVQCVTDMRRRTSCKLVLAHFPIRDDIAC